MQANGARTHRSNVAVYARCVRAPTLLAWPVTGVWHVLTARQFRQNLQTWRFLRFGSHRNSFCAHMCVDHQMCFRVYGVGGMTYTVGQDTQVCTCSCIPSRLASDIAVDVGLFQDKCERRQRLRLSRWNSSESRNVFVWQHPERVEALRLCEFHCDTDDSCDGC